MRNCIGIMGVLSVQSTYLVQSEFLYRASAGALFLDFFFEIFKVESLFAVCTQCRWRRHIYEPYRMS